MVKSWGSQAQGVVGVHGPHPWVKDGCSWRAAPQEVSNWGGNLQLDWDALGDEHSNLFHIYYGQQFD